MVKKIKKQFAAVPTSRPAPQKVVFGFSMLRRYSYTEATNDAGFFQDYLERLKRLSCLDWNTLQTTQRHGFGTEVIPCSRLKQAARNLLPSETEKLLVLRATGDNHPFLGIREGNVFQVLFIEYKFGDVYQH